MRRVARRFGVSLHTVQRWVARAGATRLDRLDLNDRPDGPARPANRTKTKMEQLVLRIRRQLKQHSALGEHGAAAIRRALMERRVAAVPSLRTIGRILLRTGALDGRRRQRRPAPPRGWYLPDLARARVELDSFDTIVDLVIAGGTDVTVLNGLSLHGGLPISRPEPRITAKITGQTLVEHWRAHGLPAYAKFDNDTVFVGARIKPDTFGRVTRICLSLGIVPVYAPPRESGFQAEIEAFNGKWQRAVWQRFKLRSIANLKQRSDRFIQAARHAGADRIDAAPPRRPFPHNWKLDLQQPLRGRVIFIRRTDDKGSIELLGRTTPVNPNWVHRLVRAEVDLSAGQIQIFALRRREPDKQPLLKTLAYKTPKRRFIE